MYTLLPIPKHSYYLDELIMPDTEKWQLHLKRVFFGEQKIEPWMFVPCEFVEDKWQALKKPYNDGENSQYYLSAMEKYQEAKQKCLFEGFWFEIRLRDDYYIRFGNLFLFTKIGLKSNWILKENIKTIDDLSKYDLKLTQTAKKQLELHEK